MPASTVLKTSLHGANISTALPVAWVRVTQVFGFLSHCCICFVLAEGRSRQEAGRWRFRRFAA